MTDLSMLTLWAVQAKPDREHLRRQMRVLRWCSFHALWAEVVLFTCIEPEPMERMEPTETVQIPEFPDAPYGPAFQIALARTIPKLLLRCDGCGVLSIHEDGFPVRFDLWDRNWLQYDYIGAAWHDGMVGGGAVSVISHNFLSATSFLPWFGGTTNCDAWWCRERRESLQREGMKFAPVEVADAFCSESRAKEQPTFAFHHRTINKVNYDKGWALIEAWEKEMGFVP